MSDVLELTRDLCSRPSVTPNDAGCQQVLAARLRAAGFAIESLRYGAVDNLWAKRGSEGPVLVFLGHTDVVPTGPVEQWRSDPFTPTIRDGKLYARGAADMKGSVAAMTLAVERFARECPNARGTIALLVTSDEEGEAQDGVRRVATEFKHRGQRIDWCVVGEPSSKTHLGDVIRVGRRGSLSGHLLVRGVQGHVAFPDIALNPIHAFAPALAELTQRRWDEGNALFPPTSFQVSNINAGTGALNVIPGELRVEFNFRFSTASTADDLMQGVEAILVKHGLDYRIEWELSGMPFATAPGLLTGAVKSAVRDVLGLEPQANTGGGTSDGRFIAPLGAGVVELGPVNATIHKIDEHVAIDDLERLSTVYFEIAKRLLT